MGIEVRGSSIGPNIIRDNLILHYDAINNRSLKFPERNLNYGIWVSGQTGSIGNFLSVGIGSHSHNTRDVDTDPWGNNIVLWRTKLINIPPPTQSGGIYCVAQPIDNTKLYRMSWWEKRVTNGAATTNVRHYAGLNGYGTTDGVWQLGNETYQTNPYFWNSNALPTSSELPTGTWVLIVGYIFPYTYTGTTGHQDSGRYTLSEKLGNISRDYRWTSVTTTARSRSLTIYSLESAGNDPTGAIHYTAYPRFDICDGTEPSLDDLLNNRTDKFYDLTINMYDGTWINGPIYDYEKKGLYFDGINDSVIINSLNYPSNWNDSVSIEAWINIPSGATWDTSYRSNIIGRGSYAGSIGLVRHPTNNVISSWFRGSTTSTQITGNIERDKWFQCISIWKNTTTDSGVTQLYINGTLIDESSEVNLGGTPDLTNWIIGDNMAFSGSAGSFFDGYISNVKIYSKDLSLKDIMLNYNSLAPRYKLDLVPIKSKDMILVFDTTLESGTQISLPLSGDTLNVDVYWGDGTSDYYNTSGLKTHTYSQEGEYVVRISGDLNYFGDESSWFSGTANNQKLTKAISIGSSLNIKSFNLSYCINLDYIDPFLPKTITNLELCFSYMDNISNYLQSIISNWDVSNVTNMSGMFRSSNFNQDINNWDVSSVTNMSGMFQSSNFNQGINNWDVSNVTNMSSMFQSSNFNQDISNWNVSNVNNMSGMFRGSDFDQSSINSWNLSSSYLFMSYMFYEGNINRALRINITSGVGDMSFIFSNSNISSYNLAYTITYLANIRYHNGFGPNNIILGVDGLSVDTSATFPWATEPVIFPYTNVNDAINYLTATPVPNWTIVFKSRCFYNNSLITTNLGYIKAEDIKIGDYITTYNFGFSEAKVIDIQEWKNIKTTVVKINNMEISPDHPIKINGEWKQSILVKEGDYIFNDKGLEEIVTFVEHSEEYRDYIDFQLDEDHAFFVDGYLIIAPRASLYYSEIKPETESGELFGIYEEYGNHNSKLLDLRDSEDKKGYCYLNTKPAKQYIIQGYESDKCYFEYIGFIVDGEEVVYSDDLLTIENQRKIIINIDTTNSKEVIFVIKGWFDPLHKQKENNV